MVFIFFLGLFVLMEIKQQFGTVLKRERDRLGWSQEKLANDIDVDQAYISRVEAGQVNLTLETIEALATALNIDPAVLFTNRP
jgi:transcriptional regulator with XRE-family HTH domain